MNGRCLLNFFFSVSRGQLTERKAGRPPMFFLSNQTTPLGALANRQAEVGTIRVEQRGDLCPKREGEREISRQVFGMVARGGVVPPTD